MHLSKSEIKVAALNYEANPAKWDERSTKQLLLMLADAGAPSAGSKAFTEWLGLAWK